MVRNFIERCDSFIRNKLGSTFNRGSYKSKITGVGVLMRFDTKEEQFNYLFKLQDVDVDKLAKRYAVARVKDSYGWEARGSFLMRLATAIVEGKDELEKEEWKEEVEEDEEKDGAGKSLPEPPKEAEERDFLHSLAEL